MTADVWNGAALALALAGSGLGALAVGAAARPDPKPLVPGEAAVVDARGSVVPVRAYQRILSLNAVADPMLLELVEPARLIAVTTHTRDVHPDGWRFGDRPAIARADQVEEILALHPDLVLASRFSDEAFLSRIREQGIAVFDLGDLRGVETTRETVTQLGRVLGVPDRAAALGGRFDRELAALLAAGGPEVAGLYVTVYGDAMFGGSTGSSYGDLLRYGGVRDLAAEAGLHEWPRYTPEDLLVLDPPVLVTKAGMRPLLCGHPALTRLKACGPEGRVIELAGGYDDDPGLGLARGAAELRAALTGESSAAPGGPPRR